MADAGLDLERIGLEPLPAAPPVAVAAPRQLTRDRIARDGHPGRQPLDDHDEAASVRFTGGQVAEHGANHREGSRAPGSEVD